jgi:3-deoxy-7-phosphoheptulonate synthase
MIIVLRPEATKSHADDLLSRIESLGLRPLYMPGTERVVLGAIGDERVLERLHLENHPMVETVTHILAPYKLVSREMHPHDTLVSIGGAAVGGSQFVVIAGSLLRGDSRADGTHRARRSRRRVRWRSAGARTSRAPVPTRSRVWGLKGLEILREVSDETGLPAVTEVVEVTDVELVERYADAFQCGARNMQNFRLLKALGPEPEAGHPQARDGGADRGPASSGGIHPGRGESQRDPLRARDPDLRDRDAKYPRPERDPGDQAEESPAGDRRSVAWNRSRELVPPMAKAAAAAGADGLLIEVHCAPEEALSDGRQSLYPRQFATMMEELAPFVRAAGKTLA